MSNGRIPQEVIDAVLKHHDIVDVVGKVVHLTKSGKYMKGLCPFHSEKTPSFTVTPEKQIFYCYGCHKGGTAIQFLMELDHCSFGEAVRQLAEEAQIPISTHEPSPVETEQQREKSALYQAYEFALKLYNYLLKNTQDGKRAMDYLRSRGFSDTLIDTFQIGYAPAKWDTLAQQLGKRNYDLSLMEKGGLISPRTDGGGYIDRFRDRVMFPIHDAKGRVIAFAGRAMGNVQPKYMNSPETVLFNKSMNLYHFHQARTHIRKSMQVVLFEGYVDVIKAWDAGVLNGVATMGTSITDQHALLLKRNAEEVIVCYDGDDAGQTAAYKSIHILEKAGCRVKVAVIPHKMDPDEYITSYGASLFINEIILATVPALKFKLHYLRRNFSLHDADERIQYVREAVKLIARLPSPTEREHYLKELSSEFHYSLDTLKQEMFPFRKALEKMRGHGDNNEIPWNNDMNNGIRTGTSPVLFPAYHNAERKLLALMIHHQDIAEYVHGQLGEQFNIEAHAALAAYLYAYYAQGHEPDPRNYIASLQDEQLEGLASAIAMIDVSQDKNRQVIDDYIREIKKVPQTLAIERLKEEVLRAERSGDVLRAAQIASEIITLEKQLKS